MFRNNAALFILFIFTINLFAQIDTTQITETKLNQEVCQKALKYYTHSLDYENTGIVESAIINIMKIKCYHPGIDYSNVIHKLQQLVKNGKTNNIKAMAFLCRNYLAIEGLSPELLKLNKEEAGQFISLLLGRISE